MSIRILTFGLALALSAAVSGCGGDGRRSIKLRILVSLPGWLKEDPERLARLIAPGGRADVEIRRGSGSSLKTSISVPILLGPLAPGPNRPDSLVPGPFPSVPIEISPGKEETVLAMVELWGNGPVLGSKPVPILRGRGKTVVREGRTSATIHVPLRRPAGRSP